MRNRISLQISSSWGWHVSKARKPLFFIVAIAALAAVVLTLTPATAATQGGGTVVGTVTETSGGIPTATEPKGPTTYSFGSINITGVFHNAGGNFVGTITIPGGVTGGSPAENTQGGGGSVNSFPINGSGAGGSSIAGNCSGTFNRTASIVVVTLSCTAAINGGAPDTATVTVVAQFTPTSGNGVTTRVQAANFAGVYVAR
jgi:hypothetical protein